MNYSRTFTLHCRLNELERLRRRLHGFGRRAGLPPKAVWMINLVLDELFTNIISHGCGNCGEKTVRFSLSRSGDDLAIKIEDNGIPFNPLSCEAPDVSCGLTERSIGGMGLHLVKHMMDHLHYRRCRDTNILEMKKSLLAECAGKGTKQNATRTGRKANEETD
ncbi:MAG: ATP-binding protein [Thermodesulfobacteriota bacterium]